MQEPQEATPSQARKDDELTPDDEAYYTDWSEFLNEHGENDEFSSFFTGLYLLLSGDTSFLGPDIAAATPSDAEKDMAVDSGDVYIVDSPEIQDASTVGLSNCVSYDVTFGGADYILYLPSDALDHMFEDKNHRLYNMTSNTITGRLFPVSSGFSPNDTTGRIVYFGAALGNNFSANRNYGYCNYVRRYYWSGNSLTYDTTYGDIIVNSSSIPFFRSLVIVLVLYFGGVALSFLIFKKR